MGEYSEMSDETSLQTAPAAARKRRRTIIATALIIAILLLAAGGSAWAIVLAQQAADPQSSASPRATADPAPSAAPSPTTSPAAEPSTDPAPQWDVDSPDSITVVVNKQRRFHPKDWAPDDLVMPDVPNNNGQPLRKPAAKAIEKMYRAAVADGVPFVIASGYRPYAMQVDLFQSYVDRDGVKAAETYSARAGHSEHQTGLVADVDDGSGCAFSECFGDTPAGTWLRKNAYRYGYVIRYQQGQQKITGYIYEPFHLRYVGTEVSRAMHAERIKTLEEFFGLPAAPDYK